MFPAVSPFRSPGHGLRTNWKQAKVQVAEGPGDLAGFTRTTVPNPPRPISGRQRQRVPQGGSSPHIGFSPNRLEPGRPGRCREKHPRNKTLF